MKLTSNFIGFMKQENNYFTNRLFKLHLEVRDNYPCLPLIKNDLFFSPRRYGRADMAADGVLNITSGVTHGGHM
jgi:hypothetical protein